MKTSHTKHEESGCTDYLQHTWQSCPENKAQHSPTFDEACEHPAIKDVLRERDHYKAHAGKLAEALRDTEKLAFDLIERAAKIDKMLCEVNGTLPECELGPVTRLTKQLAMNSGALAAWEAAQ